MFKFNFNNEKGADGSEDDVEESDVWYESKEVEIPPVVEVIKKIPRDQIVKIDYNCGITFFCLSPHEVLNRLKEKSDNGVFLDALKADKQHSDLLPGKYEGGLKIWECTKDLVVYFMKNEIRGVKNKLNKKCVLDLGCGSGILGIMCLTLEASVVFQDYNQEVLEAMTVPNIFLNCDYAVREKIKLYSGDWYSFLDLIERNNNEIKKFDYILTSETIYNTKNHKKIIAILKKLLKWDGVAFVAAKTHYFGVGGNFKEFESLIQKEGLVSRMCWETNEGVSRGILEVRLN